MLRRPVLGPDGVSLGELAARCRLEVEMLLDEPVRLERAEPVGVAVPASGPARIDDMNCFIGPVLCPLSADGRLRLPVGLGGVAVGDHLVVTRGTERCVLLYPLYEWEATFETALWEAPPMDARQLRTLQMWAGEGTVSASWEVEVPAALVKFAGLSAAAIVVGRGNHFAVRAGVERQA